MAANDIILVPIFVEKGIVSIQNNDSSDMAAGTAIVLDTAKPISASVAALGGKIGGADGEPLAVAIEKIPKGKTGRAVTGYTAFVPAIANAAITIDTWVEGDATGFFKTTVGGKPTYGKALTAAAAQNDQFLLGVTFSKNA